MSGPPKCPDCPRLESLLAEALSALSRLVRAVEDDAGFLPGQVHRDSDLGTARAVVAKLGSSEAAR